MVMDHKLIAAIHAKMGKIVPKRVIVYVLNTLYSIIVSQLIRDKRLFVRGFGTFRVTHSKLKEREWRDKNGKLVAKIKGNRMSFFFIPTPRIRREVREAWQTLQDMQLNSVASEDFPETQFTDMFKQQNDSADSSKTKEEPSGPQPETTLSHGEQL